MTLFPKATIRTPSFKSFLTGTLKGTVLKSVAKRPQSEYESVGYLNAAFSRDPGVDVVEISSGLWLVPDPVAFHAPPVRAR